MALLQTKGLPTECLAIATTFTSINPLIFGLLTTETHFFCRRQIVYLSFVNILGIQSFAQKTVDILSPIFWGFPQLMVFVLDPQLVFVV